MHGGHGRANWAKKFLKEGWKTEKLGCGSKAGPDNELCIGAPQIFTH